MKIKDEYVEIVKLNYGETFVFRKDYEGIWMICDFAVPILKQLTHYSDVVMCVNLYNGYVCEIDTTALVKRVNLVGQVE